MAALPDAGIDHFDRKMHNKRHTLGTL